jgi:hypothetical protein
MINFTNLSTLPDEIEEPLNEAGDLEAYAIFELYGGIAVDISFVSAEAFDDAQTGQVVHFEALHEFSGYLFSFDGKLAVWVEEYQSCVHWVVNELDGYDVSIRVVDSDLR